MYLPIRRPVILTDSDRALLGLVAERILARAVTLYGDPKDRVYDAFQQVVNGNGMGNELGDAQTRRLWTILCELGIAASPLCERVMVMLIRSQERQVKRSCRNVFREVA